MFEAYNRAVLELITIIVIRIFFYLTLVVRDLSRRNHIIS